MREQKVIIIVISILGIIFLVGIISFLMIEDLPLEAPNPDVQSRESKSNYILSKEFATLSEKEKIKYVRAVNPREVFRHNKDVSDKEKEELRNAIRPVFRAMMKERVDKYSQLKTKEEKIAYIDKLIDERVKRREDHLNSMSEKDKKNREERIASRKRRAPSLSRMKNRVETGDPKERAKMSEFFIDMRARMSARKISSPWGRR